MTPTPATPIPATPTPAILPADLCTRLNGLFTRTFISAATYVFEAQPFEVAEDAALLAQMQVIKDLDRDHATLLANLLRSFDCVPEPGVFPYWHRDLNYLSVPYMATFVVESLGEDLCLIEAALEAAPGEYASVRATLGVLRDERTVVRTALAPAAAEALTREVAQYADASRAVRETREAREAAEKAVLAAAKDAERKAKAAAKAKADAAAAASAPTATDPAAGMPDPSEEGISSKEKAKRTMMIKRALKKAADAAPAAAPAAAEPTAGMPDPSEEGISSKEKAKRTMMIKRARKAAEAAPVPAPAADPAAGMPDPDEPGISSKEKAKRTMMIRRAKKKP